MFSTKHTDFIVTEATACPAKPAYPEACPAGRPSAKRGEHREIIIHHLKVGQVNTFTFNYDGFFNITSVPGFPA